MYTGKCLMSAGLMELVVSKGINEHHDGMSVACVSACNRTGENTAEGGPE